MKEKPDSGRVRIYNQKKIYDLIRTNRGISRAEIAQKIGISQTSVGKITTIMIEEGLVIEYGANADGKIGRNGIQLKIVDNKVMTVAVIIDVGIIRSGIVNIAGDIFLDIEKALPQKVEFTYVVESVAQLINELFTSIGDEERKNILAIGVSVPGFTTNGFIHHSPQMFWKDVDFGKELQKYFKETVIVENNVKANALAECVYSGLNQQNDICILSMGSGVGGAVIRNGRLMRGAHNALGELGHVLVESNGSVCDCGREGCLRTHIARSSIENLCGMKLESCLAAAREGDSKCKHILDDVVRYASLLIANCIAIYDPSEIILTGDLFDDWPDFYDLVINRYVEYVWNPLKNLSVKVRKSMVLCGKHPIISAASIVFYQYLKTGIQMDTNIFT